MGMQLLRKKSWGERRGSNPRHLGPQPSALPAELRPPCAVQGLLYPFGSAVVELPAGPVKTVWR